MSDTCATAAASANPFAGKLAPGLNGWHYLLALAETQVNLGLRIAHEGEYVGPPIPRMPRGLQTLLLDAEEGTQFVCRFGCPRVRGLRPALNLCELTVPLHDAAVVERGGTTPLGDSVCLRIQTSLSSARADLGSTLSEQQREKLRVIRDALGAPAIERQHELFVNFQDERAIYEVDLGDARGPVGPAQLADLLRACLRGFSGREYRIGHIGVPATLEPYLPQRIDFSFICDPAQPERNALLVCGSLDPAGPQVDNPLSFATDILPLGLPAALWFAGGLVMRRLIMPMLKDSLATPYGMPDFVCNGSEVKLATPFSLGLVEGHPTSMDTFRIWAQGGQLCFACKVHAYHFTGFDLQAVADVGGHLAFGLSADGRSFVCTPVVGSPSVWVNDTRSGFEKWVTRIVTAGASDVIMGEVRDQIRRGVGLGSIDALARHLQHAAMQINTFADRLPSLEDSAAGGHLVFDGLGLMDDGAVFLGIRHTAVRTPDAPPPAPSGLRVVAS